ncbi:cation transporter [Klebsiella pneumoniae subsp. pneumoniae]|nr:cation transporter [Klebsiella pneumoniae subsp. pneumoniae]
MSCASCVSRVQNALAAVPGVSHRRGLTWRNARR